MPLFRFSNIVPILRDQNAEGSGISNIKNFLHSRLESQYINLFFLSLWGKLCDKSIILRLKGF